jgi:hypothetical protein
MNARLRASMPKHALIPTGRTGASQSAKLPQSRTFERLDGVDACVVSFCSDQANDQNSSQRDAPRAATTGKLPSAVAALLIPSARPLCVSSDLAKAGACLRGKGTVPTWASAWCGRLVGVWTLVSRPRWPVGSLYRPRSAYRIVDTKSLAERRIFDRASSCCSEHVLKERDGSHRLALCIVHRPAFTTVGAARE